VWVCVIKGTALIAHSLMSFLYASLFFSRSRARACVRALSLLPVLICVPGTVVSGPIGTCRYEPTTSPKAILPDIESAVNRARIM